MQPRCSHMTCILMQITNTRFRRRISHPNNRLYLRQDINMGKEFLSSQYILVHFLCGNCSKLVGIVARREHILTRFPELSRYNLFSKWRPILSPAENSRHCFVHQRNARCWVLLNNISKRSVFGICGGISSRSVLCLFSCFL